MVYAADVDQDRRNHRGGTNATRYATPEASATASPTSPATAAARGPAAPAPAARIATANAAVPTAAAINRTRGEPDRRRASRYKHPAASVSTATNTATAASTSAAGSGRPAANGSPVTRNPTSAASRNRRDSGRS